VRVCSNRFEKVIVIESDAEILAQAVLVLDAYTGPFRYARAMQAEAFHATLACTLPGFGACPPAFTPSSSQRMFRTDLAVAISLYSNDFQKIGKADTNLHVSGVRLPTSPWWYPSSVQKKRALFHEAFIRRPVVASCKNVCFISGTAVSRCRGEWCRISRTLWNTVLLSSRSKESRGNRCGLGCWCVHRWLLQLALPTLIVPDASGITQAGVT
jgi:hypothetical protein